MDITGVGSRLRQAREKAGLSQEAIAKEAGLSRVVLAYFETGARQPSLGALVALARLYGVRVTDLLGDTTEEVQPVDLSTVLFRAASEDLGDEPKAGMFRLSALVRSYVDLVGELDGKLPGKQTSSFAPEKGTAARKEAARLAREVRNDLGLGDGPVGDHLFQILDDYALIFRLPLGQVLDHSPSGLFCNHAEVGFCIVVNSDTTQGRQVFTLAHELAHAFFHSQEADAWISFQGSKEAREKFADYFAGEFLVPADALARVVNDLEAWDELSDPVLAVHLQRFFGVSYSTLLFRLKQERMINQQTFSELKDVSPSKLAMALGYEVHPADMGDYELPPLDRFPGRMLRLVRKALADGHITRGDAAETLGVSVEDVAGLAGRPRANQAEIAEMRDMEQVAHLGE